MSADPIEVVGEWLQNLLDPDVVNRLVARDANYVSLNTDDPELQKIMPWTGTSHGPQAFLNNLGTMFTRWENQAFNVTAMFASRENVAVFGDFLPGPLLPSGLAYAIAGVRVGATAKS